jgi:DNA-directed RNA polymerase specialized sigma24 family protein
MPGEAVSDYLAYVHGRVTAIRRTAYLLSGDADEADDIVQETLTRLYTRWRRIQHVDNLDAYLDRILTRVFLDARRRGCRRRRPGGRRRSRRGVELEQPSGASAGRAYRVRCGRAAHPRRRNEGGGRRW